VLSHSAVNDMNRLGASESAQAALFPDGGQGKAPSELFSNPLGCHSVALVIVLSAFDSVALVFALSSLTPPSAIVTRHLWL
jgi:hypothetical protein